MKYNKKYTSEYILKLQIHQHIDPFDVSNISIYPNKFDKHLCLKSILTFHKDEDIVARHITKFKEVLVAWDITNEDTIMELFVMSLGIRRN